MNVAVGRRTRHYRTVTFDPRTNEVRLIEQRLLPHQFKIVATRNYKESARAIADMVVRGAPAIAATAAYSLAQGAQAFRGRDLSRFHVHVRRVFDTLKSARPTAVDPVNAMTRLLDRMRSGDSVAECQRLLVESAEVFADEDVDHCRAIGRHGAKLIRSGTRILTHCNAGWLACVDIGTATAPMYEAQARGRDFHVFCNETRPRCQGATLTAWELAQQGVSHQVIADNAAGHLMQRGEIDLVIVGSDRTLGRTGDVANKIGTYTKAVLAWRHNIPFYVAIPLSTIDWTLKSGMDIPIEERGEEEVLGAWGVVRGRAASSTAGRTARASGRRSSRGTTNPCRVWVANPGSRARNPSFDVTPAELVTGIITPLGIFKPKDLWRRRRDLRPAPDQNES